MIELKTFVDKIDNFYSIASSKQIKYFVYYLQVNEHLEAVTPRDIAKCFDSLHINPYSNIAQYLRSSSKKSSSQEFLTKKKGYILIASLRQFIEAEIGKEIEVAASNSLYPLEIFENTPSYLEAFAHEASICYDYKLYNSCLFMLRKISETLIIELFERKGLQNKIKNPRGDYFQLADLIKTTVSENSWKLSKIVKENLPKIKLLADSSVHSKRFKARKADIDTMKTDLRIVFEEIIILIEYPGK
ncbi:hypothetical protein [Flavobacterium sp. NRK1]|uniref:hypothetical protein n=1 Tax=Flavobacterium sp. NRK1 TaxID=2954929 RepID=UPI002093B214|nr:hypothetical protein [Flavobacterium sp. NRK1]MCO6148966.1 hypothetical protein [Flavobacterium sp. NRK1]